MEVGICLASKIDEVGYVEHAENLGYRSAWFGDSQMIWSDCFACAALAAQRTRTIRIGTGVTVAGTRLAPVTAAAIASVNRLAPGRTFVGLGRGDSSFRLMGQRPTRMSDFEEFCRVVRALVRGEEIEFTRDGRTRPIRLQMAELGFVDVEHEIPMWIAGLGPRGRAIAGRLADGVVDAPLTPAGVRLALDQAASGAAEIGRTLDRSSFRFALSTNAVVLDPGEELTSQRVIEHAGTYVMLRLHNLYLAATRGRPEAAPDTSALELPPEVEEVWDDFCGAIAAVPERLRHQRIQAGHLVYVTAEEAPFVTPALIGTSLLVGTPSELVERLRQLEAAGVDELLLFPPLAVQYESIERFSRLVLTQLESF